MGTAKQYHGCRCTRRATVRILDYSDKIYLLVIFAIVLREPVIISTAELIHYVFRQSLNNTAGQSIYFFPKAIWLYRNLIEEPVNQDHLLINAQDSGLSSQIEKVIQNVY